MHEYLSASEHNTTGRIHRISMSENIVKGIVSATDGAAALLGGGAAYWVYMGWDHENQRLYFVAMALLGTLTVSWFRRVKLHDMDVIMSWPSHVGHIAINSGIPIVVLTALAFACKLSDSFSRVWVVATYAISLGLLCLFRTVLGVILRKRVGVGTLTRNVAIVGAGHQGKQFVIGLTKHSYPWQRLVGIFDDRRTRVPDDLGCRFLGDLNHLVHYVERGEVDDIMVALPWNADNRVIEIIDKLRDLPVHIYLVCDLIGYRLSRYGQRIHSGVPVLEISRAPCAGWKGVAKSFVDKSLSFVILVFGAPVLFLVAVAIKLDSPGPVLFRQKRVGFNNKLIEVFKFRTMYHHMRDDDATTLTSRGDQRITPTGRFLRRTSLDELPQLLNVLKGDMSLVGPRPHAIRAKANGKLYNEVVARYAARHRVKPGITGWAQIKGWRGETDTEEKIIKRVEHDLFYIENWSLWFDMHILVRTTLAALRQENAF
jgi:Undecaprenyl-phosphate glucose phosphotransferase